VLWARNTNGRAAMESRLADFYKEVKHSLTIHKAHINNIHLSKRNKNVLIQKPACKYLSIVTKNWRQPKCPSVGK
jgi:hypothetical protein